MKISTLQDLLQFKQQAYSNLRNSIRVIDALDALEPFIEAGMPMEPTTVQLVPLEGDLKEAETPVLERAHVQPKRPCQYCRIKLWPSGIAQHEKYCLKNPNRLIPKSGRSYVATPKGPKRATLKETAAVERQVQRSRDDDQVQWRKIIDMVGDRLMTTREIVEELRREGWKFMSGVPSNSVVQTIQYLKQSHKNDVEVIRKGNKWGFKVLSPNPTGTRRRVELHPT